MERKQIRTIFIILGIVFLCYSNTLFNGFLWDDDDLIVNYDATKSLANIPGYFIPKPDEGYRPLRHLSFAFDYFFFKLNPFFYHLENLLIHLANVFLVMLIILLIYKNEEMAYATGLIFGVHPAWNEAIVWAKNRHSLLACLFFLLAFYFFIRRKDAKSVIFFVLALFTKEVAIAFPLITSAYVLLFEDKKGLKRTIIPWLLAGLYTVYITVIYKGGGMMFFSPGENVFFSLKILLKFVYILIFPFRLNAERPVSFDASIFDYEVIAAFLLFILLVFFILKTKKKGIVFAVLWVILNLLPTVNPATVAGRPLGEQRLYIPGIGLAVLLYLILKNKKVVLYALILLFFFTSFKRNFVWKNGLIFWREAVRIQPDSTRALLNYSLSEMEEGNWATAEQYLLKALKIDPYSNGVTSALISIYTDTGRHKKAEETAVAYLKKVPADFDVWRALLKLYISQNRYDEANRTFDEVAKLMEWKTLKDGDYSTFGTYAFQLGKLDDAERMFTKAALINPLSARAYTSLGALYRAKDDITQAMVYYKKAIKANPHFVEALYNLANCHGDMKENEKAVEYYLKAVEIDPGFSDAWYNLGVTLEALGDYGRAEEAYRNVMNLEPQNQEIVAKYNEVKNKSMSLNNAER